VDGEWRRWTTANGNLLRAKISDVCGWVKRSWDKVADEIIVESFKKCGITDSFVDEDVEIEEESETKRSKVEEESEIEKSELR
jgi:hypothetical protein